MRAPSLSLFLPAARSQFASPINHRYLLLLRRRRSCLGSFAMGHYTRCKRQQQQPILGFERTIRLLRILARDASEEGKKGREEIEDSAKTRTTVGSSSLGSSPHLITTVCSFPLVPVVLASLAAWGMPSFLQRNIFSCVFSPSSLLSFLFSSSGPKSFGRAALFFALATTKSECLVN